MKESEARVDQPGHQMLLYVEKEDGSYGTVQTGSWMVKNLIDDFQEKQRYFHETYSAQVMKGEVSPLVYYMNLQELTAVEVADRTRIGVGAVRKQMTPKGFLKMTVDQATRYADLFGIPVMRLFAIVNLPPDRSIVAQYQAVANPAVCAMNIGLNPNPNPTRGPQ
jgi:hypothetical protein